MFLYYIYFLQRLNSHPKKLSMIFIFWRGLSLYFEIQSKKYSSRNISVENESYNCYDRVRLQIVDNTGIPGCIWHLGKGANNQNGNLRWHLPWRGGSRGGLECHIPILKNDFSLKPLRIIPWLWKRVLHLVWALYYVYIVVEMTLNMAK